MICTIFGVIEFWIEHSWFGLNESLLSFTLDIRTNPLYSGLDLWFLLLVSYFVSLLKSN